MDFFRIAENSQRKLQYVLQWNRIKYATLYIAACSFFHFSL